MSGSSNATPSQPLARLLEHTADAVQAVRGGKSLTDVLARVPAELRPGVQALSFHTLRWLGSATVARERLVPKPPAPNVDALLLTALALLWPAQAQQRTAYAEHTLVDQAVTAAQRRMPAAAGFINAVLRRFLRERETIVQAVRVTPLGAYNHPLWWIDRIKVDWPQAWQGC
jgi:16S rRNA (cytosine967-C5)-methyltransferase